MLSQCGACRELKVDAFECVPLTTAPPPVPLLFLHHLTLEVDAFHDHITAHLLPLFGTHIQCPTLETISMGVQMWTPGFVSPSFSQITCLEIKDWMGLDEDALAADSLPNLSTLIIRDREHTNSMGFFALLADHNPVLLPRLRHLIIDKCNDIDPVGVVYDCLTTRLALASAGPVPARLQLLVVAGCGFSDAWNRTFARMMQDARGTFLTEVPDEYR